MPPPYILPGAGWSGVACLPGAGLSGAGWSLATFLAPPAAARKGGAQVA